MDLFVVGRVRICNVLVIMFDSESLRIFNFIFLVLILERLRMLFRSFNKVLVDCLMMFR